LVQGISFSIAQRSKPSAIRAIAPTSAVCWICTLVKSAGKREYKQQDAAVEIRFEKQIGTYQPVVGHPTGIAIVLFRSRRNRAVSLKRRNQNLVMLMSVSPSSLNRRKKKYPRQASDTTNAPADM
jgi:hypothetical protein